MNAITDMMNPQPGKLELWLGEYTVYLSKSQMDRLINDINAVEDGECVLISFDNEAYSTQATYKRPHLKFAYNGERWQIPKAKFQKLRDECSKVKDGEAGFFSLGFRPLSVRVKKS